MACFQLIIFIIIYIACCYDAKSVTPTDEETGTKQTNTNLRGTTTYYSSPEIISTPRHSAIYITYKDEPVKKPQSNGINNKQKRGLPDKNHNLSTNEASNHENNNPQVDSKVSLNNHNDTKQPITDNINGKQEVDNHVENKNQTNNEKHNSEDNNKKYENTTGKLSEYALRTVHNLKHNIPTADVWDDDSHIVNNNQNDVNNQTDDKKDDDNQKQSSKKLSNCVGDLRKLAFCEDFIQVDNERVNVEGTFDIKNSKVFPAGKHNLVYITIKRQGKPRFD